MNNKEIELLEDIKKLLILQLLASRVRANEIAEIFEMDPSNFSKAYPASKLIARLRSDGDDNKRK